MSPVAAAPAGEHTPLEQFEADIRKSLGSRLLRISDRGQIDVGESMKVFRVVCDGEYTLQGKQEEIKVPTQWIYYLCAAPSGRQVSFVFAAETALQEQFAGRDEALVRSLQFSAARGAVKTVNRPGTAE
jgi:hypothetical protein